MEDYSDDNNYDDNIYEEDRVYVYNGSEANPIFTDHHSMPKSNERSIRSDLEKLNLPSNIVNIADRIYQDMDVGTKRGKRRKMLLFYCSFTAYNQENIPVDPIWLANICGIERSSISKALSMCSPVTTNSDNLIVQHHPKDFILTFYEKLKQWVVFPENALDEIYDMMNDVLENDGSLVDEKPQTVAAAILVYYMKNNGYSIEKESYNTIFRRSDMTINKVKKKVIDAYNK